MADISENRPRVTASVVTWNHAHCIEACLDSLLQQKFGSLEVIVHDNASQDETRTLLTRYSSRIKIRFAEVNSGFCGGHNSNLAATYSEFVLLVNPDVVLPPDYIAKAVNAMIADPQIGTVCGLLLQGSADDSSCTVDGAGLTMSRSRHPILRFHRAKLSAINPESREVFGCDGALPLFRRKMIDDISIDGQFFDEMFFAHKEDHDIAWRAQIFGWKTHFEAGCVAIHPRHFRPGNLSLRRKIAPEMKYHAVKNDILLLLKNEDVTNLCKDFFHIVPRQVAILSYVLLFERTSLKAYSFILKNLGKVLQKRKNIQKRRKSTPLQVRQKFFLTG
ncbi:MAG: glycosyltransferase [Limisphaerales bacterium]